MMFPSRETVSGVEVFGRLLNLAATGSTAPPQARTIGRTVFQGVAQLCRQLRIAEWDPVP
jgi:hypothetical protein